MLKVRPTKNVVMIFSCAIIVFFAYLRMGYYRWFSLPRAIFAYYRERIRLGAFILVATNHGIPVGTLMCAVDKGVLPVDDIFPDEMAAIRAQGKPVAYFGKFGVIPLFQGALVGNTITEWVKKWTRANGIDTAVILVNPYLLRFYERLGFVETTRSPLSPSGLYDAPTVLMTYVPRRT